MTQAPIDHIAQKLLFGNTLKDKMWMPDQVLKEESTNAIAIPDQPGRPKMLSCAS